MAETKKKSVFEILNSKNVNEHTESKNGLTYLSWAWAWAEVKKEFPDAVYEIVKQENGRPYIFDPATGYMVYTSVTIDNITHCMWLPVMDGNNKAMLDHPYEIKGKYKSITVQPATMFDINKTIMRCLTKNLAMFGLGLYIYAGEDIPEVTDEEIVQPKPVANKPAPKQEAPKTEVKKAQFPNRNDFIKFCNDHGLDIPAISKELGLSRKTPDAEFIKALAYATKLSSKGDDSKGEEPKQAEDQIQAIPAEEPSIEDQEAMAITEEDKLNLPFEF